MSHESHGSDVPSHPERRRYPRCKAALPVELHPEGGSVPLRTNIDEIGPGGCYVETMFTFAVGTKLTIKFWLESLPVNASGVIATCYPQVGNGIEFVGMSAEDRQKLAQFVKDHTHPE